MKTREDFIYWEAQSRETIDFKMIYVDITGDLIAGLMLSQIIYWHLPNKRGQQKLRVSDNEGQRWIAKRYDEWHSEIRITKDQARRGLKILKDLQIVEVKNMRFQNMPCIHIRLNFEVLIALLNKQKSTGVSGFKTTDSGSEPIDCGLQTTGSGFKTTDSGSEPISNNRDYTEITSEITSEKEEKRVAAQLPLPEEVLINGQVFEIPKNRKVNAPAGQYHVWHLPKYQPGWFVKFLLIYPIKISDMKSFGKHWDSAKLSAKQLNQIKSDLPERLKNDGSWQKGKIHHPRTYISEEMWEEPVTTVSSSQNKIGRGAAASTGKMTATQRAKAHLASGGNLFDKEWNV